MPLSEIISNKSFGGLENNLRSKAQKVLKEKALYDWLEYLKRIEGSGYRFQPDRFSRHSKVGWTTAIRQNGQGCSDLQTIIHRVHYGFRASIWPRRLSSSHSYLASTKPTSVR